MEKNEWYRDRILWKAKQHDLFNKRCSKFSELSLDRALVIKDIVSEEMDAVMIFWESKSTWTILGTTKIFSFYNENLFVNKLDEICKEATVFREPNEDTSGDVKFNANFICLERTGVLIWAPSGPELFALLNILLMFPLKKKGDGGNKK